MPRVHIPSLLQDLTRNVTEVEIPVAAGTQVSVRDILNELDRRYPGFAERLLYEGDLMPGMAVFVDGEQTRLGLREKVGAGTSDIHFIPPVSGGQ